MVMEFEAEDEGLIERLRPVGRVKRSQKNIPAYKDHVHHIIP